MQQAITQLQDKNNRVQTESNVIAGILVECYEELLGRKDTTRTKAQAGLLKNGPTLTMEQLIELVEPFTKRDIRNLCLE